MSKWALCGRSLYKFSQHSFFQESNNSFKYFTLSLKCNRHIFSKNVIITNSPEIFSKLPTKSRLLQNQHDVLVVMSNRSSISSGEQQSTSEVLKLSSKDKLKRAVKDYGATVIIFHVTLSLMSLGLSYLIISSGVDVASLMDKVGFKPNDIAAGASTFVVAYACHKVFAPVRISITLGATPFIVRYLRKVKILKPPKVTGP